MSRARAPLWLIALALPLIACMQFSEQAYCAANTSTCELTVTSVSPTFGPSSGFTEIMLYGTAFEPDMQVELGGVKVFSETGTTATLMRIVTPPGTPGLKDLVLRTRYQTLVVPGAFEYDPPARVTELTSEGSRYGGSTIVLRGANLWNFSGPFEPELRVGGVPIPYTFKTPDVITATTPGGPPGPVDVEIQNGYLNLKLPGAYRYVEPWVEVNQGLFGGSALKVVVDPGDANILYAVTRSGRLYRSTARGTSWEYVAGVPSVRSLVIDRPRGALYAATTDGVWRSSNGTDWTDYNDPVSSGVIHELAIYGAGTLLARKDSAVLRRDPGAATWSATFGNLPWPDPVNALAVAGSSVYFATPFGVARYLPGPDDWVWVTSLADVRALAVMPGMEDTVLAVAPGGLYRSAPSGDFPLVQPGDISAVVMDPAVPGDAYLAVGDTLMRSRNSGVTWATLAQLPRAVLSIALDPAGGVGAVGVAGLGTFVKDVGGATFTRRVNGFAAAEVRSLAVEPGTPDKLYAAANEGLYRTDESGTWTPVSLPGDPISTVVRAHPAQPGLVLVGTRIGIFRSEDAGNSWARVLSEDVKDIRIAPAPPHRAYAATTTGVWRSQDGGATWLQVGLGSAGGIAVTNSSPERIFGASGDVIYAVTYPDGVWQRMGTVNVGGVQMLECSPEGKTLLASGPSRSGVSDDGGARWGTYSGPTFAAILSDGVETRNVVASPSGLRSGSGALDDMSRGLRTRVVTALAVHPGNPRILYAGTIDAGVARSTIGGGM